MGRVINTPLDGGMRGGRGQHRGSEDNEFLHAENLIHERGRVLRNRPATDPLPIGVLPTDRVIPFEWEGEEYFFIYDPCYEFNWRLEEEVEPGVAGLSTMVQTDTVSPQDNDPLVFTPYAQMDRLLEYNYLLPRRNVNFNEIKNIWPHSDFYSTVIEGLARGDKQHLSNRAMFFLASSYAANIGGAGTENKIFGQYKFFYMASLTRFNRTSLFYAWDTPAAVKSAADRAADGQRPLNPRNFVRPLFPRLSFAFMWHRFLIKDSEGRVVSNGVNRAMPLSYCPPIRYRRNNGLADMRRKTGLGFIELPDADRTAFQEALYGETPRREGLIDYLGGGEYLMTEGLTNFVCVDKEGHMPPLVIEAERGKTQFTISELNVKYFSTGLRFKHMPSLLTRDETVNQVDDFFWRDLSDTVGNKVYKDVPLVSLTELRADLPGSRFNNASREKIEDNFKAIMAEGDGNQYVTDALPFVQGRRDSVPLVGGRVSRSDLGPVFPLYNSTRDEVTQEPPDAGGNVTSALRIRQKMTASVRLRVSPHRREEETLLEDGFLHCNPFYEQCPVVESGVWTPLVVDDNTSFSFYEVTAVTTEQLFTYVDTLNGDRAKPTHLGFYFNPTRVVFFRQTTTGSGRGEMLVNRVVYVFRGTYTQLRRQYLESIVKKATDSSGRSFFYANREWHTGEVTVDGSRTNLNDGRKLTAPYWFDMSGTPNSDLLPTVIPPTINSTLAPLISSEYVDFIGKRVIGFSPIEYPASVLGDGGRYVFSRANPLRRTLYVTNVNSGRGAVPYVEGPETGRFGFGSGERIRADENTDLTNYGYVQPLTREGGLEILWVDRSGGDLVVVGTDKGKIHATGIDLKALLEGRFDPSDIPSTVLPVRVRGVLYQVMEDGRQVYVIEGSEERRRNTWRSVTSPISDYLDFRGRTNIKSMTGFGSTGRLVILTEEGRVFCGLIQPQGDVTWTELTFPEGAVNDMDRIGETLFLSVGGSLKRLDLNLTGPIEEGATLALSIKHPAAYLAGQGKGLSSYTTPKYFNGHLLGSFKAGLSPEEVTVGTHKMPEGRKSPRSLTRVGFGATNMKDENDGLRFEFKARNVEVDSLHMEVKD